MVTPLRGEPAPLGATPGPDGVNFSVWAGASREVELLLYERADDDAPRRVIALQPHRHRSYHYWHLFVPGLRAGQIYAWRTRGAPGGGDGCGRDGDKVLLDPYGRAMVRPAGYSREAARRPGRNDAVACKSVVVDTRRYDWEGDAPLRRPYAQTVIYEMHVGGFTRHPSSGLAPQRRGTYGGVVDKIPYLRELGITAVELLPVFAFDEQDAPQGLTNYWGYAPMSFFVPHGGYSQCGGGAGVLDEFRDMVKALHRAGIEVILDVVYNHTAEGDERGPTFSWRGLDNDTYYILEGEGRHANYSGTGNTLAANQSVVRRMIIDSLHYWVREMHVDGFRFDLAAILARDEQGRPLARPPVLFDIETDPVLAGTKLIAEAWDAAGLYQVGHFPGESWKEWNGQFRDDVRAFVRGDSGLVRRMADRLMGSPDLYGARPREPAQSINFVTSHDGFTLNDLVSYNTKHNEANGEDNRDGTDHHLSWNCGAEGPSTDIEVERLRGRQIRNLLAINILSLGTPMLLMGDEARRTQHGNNNAYCQDNETSWFDWSLVQRHADIHRFVRGLIKLRGLRESVRDAHPLTLAELMSLAQVQLHGVQLARPDLAHDSHSLAITAASLSGDLRMHFALNAWWQPLAFQLPALPAEAVSGWRRVIDTSRPAPHDLVDPRHGEPVEGATHTVAERSVVVLFAAVRPTAAMAGPLSGI